MGYCNTDRCPTPFRTLLNLQVKYPENFFLLRGNHECASINRIYGFYDECKRRYNIRLWKTFTDCFNCLPVAALVDEKVCYNPGLHCISIPPWLKRSTQLALPLQLGYDNTRRLSSLHLLSICANSFWHKVDRTVARLCYCLYTLCTV